ncbi:hypothetical protein, partial [Xanthovirga aplysinae]|uniref:hypothetical protein n=1 Tax=Xanthovirga aplysinae TaxID=2529853 RepID=UPI0012BCFE61
MKKLVIFTNEYPYGKSETFFKEELKILSGSFEVTLCPATTYGQPRGIPKGVHVDLSYGTFLKLGRPISMLFSCIDPIVWKGLITHFKNLTSSSAIRRVMAVTYFANKTFEWIKYKYGNETQDIIFYSYWMDYAALGIAFAAAKTKRITGISRAHGYDLYEERYKPPFWPYRCFLLNQLKAVFTISENGKAYLEERYGENAKKVVISRLGTKSHVVRAKASEENHLHLVSCSSLIPLKRVELLMQGVLGFAKKHPKMIIKWTHM